MKINTLYLLMITFLLFFFYLGCKPRQKEPDITPQQIFVAKITMSLLKESELALERRDYLTALALADSAGKYTPNLPSVHFLRALILEKLYRFEESQDAYEKILLIDPYYRGARFNMGNNAFRIGQFRKAIGLYRKEQEIGPRADVYANMGLAYSNLYKADSAEWAYLQAIALDSSYSKAYTMLGQLYKDDGEIEKAFDYTYRGLILDPNNVHGQYIYGTLLLQAGQLEDAITYLEKAKEKLPWNQGVHNNLGQALLRLGRQEEGNRYLARADTLREWQSKIEEQRGFIDIQPGNPVNWIRLGNILHSAGRIEEAIEAYEISLSINHRNIPLQETVAYLWLSLGDTIKAVPHYHAILQQDSTHADTWFNLGVVYANTGKLNEARIALQNALNYNPNDTTAKTYIENLPIR